MPTHPLIQYVEGPNGLGHDILDQSSATMPSSGSGSSITPHTSLAEKAEKSVPNGLPLACMFCEKVFEHEEDLGPHLLDQHPTTLHAPAVLRVEAEFLNPAERTHTKTCQNEPNEEPSCDVCGQVTENAAELDSHMRKHKDSFIYCCNLCGRRFKEPWFLKNHMRTHGKSRSSKNQDAELPITINDIVQDRPASPASTTYKMCMVCGFFFLNKDVLVEHSKVHNRDPEPDDDRSVKGQSETSSSQDDFLQCLSLHRTSQNAEPKSQPGRGISQLDPFNTYQAWQLATKGKIAAGPNPSKEPNPESNSDNEEFGSDKEELGSIWDSSGGEKLVRRGLRTEMKARLGGGTPSIEQTGLSLRKDKPTDCEECGKTFRTYHQLVLHSRIHKKERGGADSPTTPGEGRTPSVGSAESLSLDQAEEGSEDGFEEGLHSEEFHSDKTEDGSDKMKLKILMPRKCCYCGKTFRSNYYLNIHLRTHTGEKPYKCEYCDYAAAQKTSLRYHLDRRHKDKPYAEIANIPASSTPNANGSANGSKGRESPSNTDDKSTLKISKPVIVKHEAPVQPAISIPISVIRVKKELTSRGTTSLNTPPNQPRVNGSLHIDPKPEWNEAVEAPLDLSLKVPQSVPATSVPRSMLLTSSCTSCSYETFYPELLLMHRKLLHKEKTDAKKYSYRPPVKLKRYTGCPPALEGKDVTPLAALGQARPRRTKSPTPQPGKSTEKTQTSRPPQVTNRAPTGIATKKAELTKTSPVKESRREKQNVTQRIRVPETVLGVQPRFQDSVVEASRKFSIPPVSQKPNPVKNGIVWPSETNRLCLSDRFRNLSQTDIHHSEPSSKRPKTSEAAQGTGRICEMNLGRNMKSFLPIVPNHLPPMPSGSSMDVDWNVINLLRSYTPNELTSLYQPVMPASSHAVAGNAAGAGNRALLLQHYANSIIQRRSHHSPPDATS